MRGQQNIKSVQKSFASKRYRNFSEPNLKNDVICPAVWSKYITYSYLLTYILPPWSSVLLEKLTRF